MFEQLRIRNFRGLADMTIDTLGGINLIAGRNNVGKTTLIEAIWLLCGAANARMAVNSHVIRGWNSEEPPQSTADTFWKQLFSGLDTNKLLTVSGRHASVGDMELTVAWGSAVRSEIARDRRSTTSEVGLSGDRSLEFTYVDPRAGQLTSEARETAEKFEFVQNDKYIPFAGIILQPGSGSINQDAVNLGQLRKQKRGDQLLEALRIVEPDLLGIEDNSSSGAPMIWVDIGLSELVPLPVMGAGMTHLARIVLAAASANGGVVLVDEIENGLHHGVLPRVWRVVQKAVEQFNVQFFATTHSFECMQAAYETLGADGFRLHRLEAADGVNRCVTYESSDIDTAIRHAMEFR